GGRRSLSRFRERRPQVQAPRQKASRLVGTRAHAQPPVAADQTPRRRRVDRRHHGEKEPLGSLAPHARRDRQGRRRERQAIGSSEGSRRAAHIRVSGFEFRISSSSRRSSLQSKNATLNTKL